jgi:hypothetical protein
LPAALQDSWYTNANFKTFVSTSGAIVAAISTVEQAGAKYLHALAGLSTTGITTYTGVTWSTIAASVLAKTAMWNNDGYSTGIAANATALTALRGSASATAILSWTENGTTAVSITGPVSGGKYFLLGLSRATSQIRAYTFATKRAGTALANPSSDGSGDTGAVDASTAGMPLTAPITALLSGTGTTLSYARFLRCDV